MPDLQSDSLYKLEGFKCDTDRKKRLGQYFSGVRLAKFLATLARLKDEDLVLDPMVGIGDMLAGCQQVARAHLNGIEIDPLALTYCKDRLQESVENLTLGNAFSLSSINSLASQSWDLIITNPPYIRYQSAAKRSGNKNPIPSGEEIRRDLEKVISHNIYFDETDKQLFRTLCKNYSGLSDVAVPAWILCASLVKMGGTIAMVLPSAWLTRDYSFPILYLVLRWFKIQHLVEDAHNEWFPEAQVKTTLLVAKRVQRKKSAFEETDEYYQHTKIFRGASNDYSVVGNVLKSSSESEAAVTKLLYDLLEARKAKSFQFMESKPVQIKSLQERLYSHWKVISWHKDLEKAQERKVKDWIPEQLASFINLSKPYEFASLDDMGVKVGQGLRTGANRFFYMDKTSERNRLKASSMFHEKIIDVPEKYTRNVIRKQADTGNKYAINGKESKGKVLVLGGYYRDIDIQFYPSTENFDTLPKSLSEYITEALRKDFGTSGNTKSITELSAVAPNSRPARIGKPPCFWYQLPAFAPRHVPELFVPRINHSSPTIFLNEDSETVIDANFSTIWLEPDCRLTKYALLAILNSNWSKIFLEMTASALGAGALKIEASHFKKLQLPVLGDEQVNAFDQLGRELKSKEFGEDIDTLEKINLLLETDILNIRKRKEFSSLLDKAIAIRRFRKGN